jgi:hypothetical protein
LSLYKVDVVAPPAGTRFAHSPYSIHRERAMKKQGTTTDAKREAANDKLDNGKTEKAKKVSKPS